jgi:hypothetical protein
MSDLSIVAMNNQSAARDTTPRSQKLAAETYWPVATLIFDLTARLLAKGRKFRAGERYILDDSARASVLFFVFI